MSWISAGSLFALASFNSASVVTRRMPCPLAKPSIQSRRPRCALYRSPGAGVRTMPSTPAALRPITGPSGTCARHTALSMPAHAGREAVIHLGPEHLAARVAVGIDGDRLLQDLLRRGRRLGRPRAFCRKHRSGGGRQRHGQPLSAGQVHTAHAHGVLLFLVASKPPLTLAQIAL